MSTSIKAHRKGRNLYNFSTASLGFKGTTRRNTYIGKDCIQNRMNSESYMRHTNYDGRIPTEVKKCTTLSRAIAVEEQRRRADVPPLRPRPGYLGAEGADALARTDDAGGGGGLASGGGGPVESALPAPGGGGSAGSWVAGGAGSGAGAGGSGGSVLSASRSAPRITSAGSQTFEESKAPVQRVNWIDTRGQPGELPGKPDVPSRKESTPSQRSPAQSLRRAQTSPAHMATPEPGRGGSSESGRSAGAQQEEPQHRCSGASDASRAALDELQKQPQRDLARSDSGSGIVPAAAKSQFSSPAASRKGAASPEPRKSDRSPSPRVPPGSETGNSCVRSFTGSTRTPVSALSDHQELSNSRLSQTLSVGGSQFGSSGERLDPNKWAAANTRNKKKPGINSGHYEYIVEQLWRKRQEASDEAEREELDRQLAVIMHERGPTPVTSPRPPMSTAFTDRSLRKREGLGSKASLHHPEEERHRGVMHLEDRNRSTPHLLEDGTGGAMTPGTSECGSMMWDPNLVSPAGQPSHSVHHNVPAIVHDTSQTAVSPQTARAKSAMQGKRTPGSPNYNSGHVTRSFKEVPSSAADSQIDRLDERALTTQMGTKVKASAGQLRSRSADPSTAGRFRRKMELDLEAFPHNRHRAEGHFDPTSTRNEVAMILSPRSTDPPRPKKITACKRADGENKNRISKDSEKVMVHWNQPLYRYECAAVRDLDRSNSLPSDHFVTIAPGESSPGRGEHYIDAAGDYRRQAWGAASRIIATKVETQVGRTTNHELLAENASRDRSNRLAHEQHFSDLCAFTEEAARAQSKEYRGLRERESTKQGVADALAWPE